MGAAIDAIQIRKYTEYKDSGIDWLGEMPVHWEMLANKYIFRLKKNQVGKKSRDYTLLSLTLNGVVKRDMDNPQGKFPADFNTYQEVTKGDFIFCLFDVEETPRTVGLSNFEGMITGAYTVFESSMEFDKKFLYYFYLNIDIDKKMKPLYTGLRNTISKEAFFSFKTFKPPLEEQKVIATYLDRKLVTIDKAIAIKEKQIELLNERRQILIHKAVTRGLDLKVKVKDSGVDWIGKIPEHWNIQKNYALFIERNDAGNETLQILSVSIHDAVSSQELTDEENIRGKIRIEDKTLYKRVSPNDIVFNMMRAWQGAIGAVKIEGMVSPAYIVAKPTNSIYAQYFECLYRTKNFIEQMDRNSKGITDFRKRLYWNEFKQLLTILPPLNEQMEIVDFVKNITEKTETATRSNERLVMRLKEYKKTLVDNIVTGKVKVTN